MTMASSSYFNSFMIFGFALAMTVAPLAEARAFFVFGDSLVDSGNNNYLATTARADAPPYGIDYPTRRPTGRFSNGLNIADIISKFLFVIANITFFLVFFFVFFFCKYALLLGL